MAHLPFNHILSLLDAGQVERAVAESAVAVGTYVPEAANFCVYPKGIDAEALNDALWRLYSASDVWPSLIKDLGKVVWPGNPVFCQ